MSQEKRSVGQIHQILQNLFIGGKGTRARIYFKPNVYITIEVMERVGYDGSTIDVTYQESSEPQSIPALPQPTLSQEDPIQVKESKSEGPL